jgi:hypothetical protein
MGLLLLFGGEAAAAGGEDVSTLAVFDGVHQPRPIVLMAVGGETELTPTTYQIGVGPGIGTGSIGGTTWLDITHDVDAISITGPELDEIESTSSGTCTLLVSNETGDYDPENLASPTLPDLDVAIWVRAEWQGVYTTRFLGVLDAIVPDDAPPRPSVTFRCVDGLAQLGRTQLAALSVPDFDADTTGGRVNRICDAALWPSSKRAVDLGRSRLGRTTLGASALQLLAKVAATEFGYLYLDHHTGGILTFAARYKTTTATRSTTVQATITDAGGMNALERSKDRERLFNDIHVTRDPNPSEPVTSESLAGPDDEPVEQVAFDQTSVNTYGLLSFPGEAFPLARSDSEALAAAQWLAPRYAVPQTRITTVGVQGVGHNQWTELLGLRLLDRIRVQRTAVAVPLDRQLIVQQISEEISRIQRSWDFTLATEAPQAAEPASVYKVGLGPGLGTGSIGW